MTKKTASAAPRSQSKSQVKKSAPRPPTSQNPLLARWPGQFGEPPFAKISARHFRPALQAAFKAHKAEIEKIAANTARPTFANTILALEKSGTLLSRVGSVRASQRIAGLRPRFTSSHFTCAIECARAV